MAAPIPFWEFGISGLFRISCFGFFGLSGLGMLARCCSINKEKTVYQHVLLCKRTDITCQLSVKGDPTVFVHQRSMEIVTMGGEGEV